MFTQSRIRGYLRILFFCGSAQAVFGQFYFDDYYNQTDCFTCLLDVSRESYNKDHPCLVPSDEKDLARCSRNAHFCQVEVTRVGGALVLFERRCATQCQPGCLEKGFGIVRKMCTFCCPDDPACGEKEF